MKDLPMDLLVNHRWFVSLFSGQLAWRKTSH
jgi:hypothetical protein